jgi:hypothetical protein
VRAASVISPGSSGATRSPAASSSRARAGVAGDEVVVAERELRLRTPRGEGAGALGGGEAPRGERRLGRVRVQERRGARQLHPGAHEARVEGDRLRVRGDRAAQRGQVGAAAVPRVLAAQEGVVGVEVRRRPLGEARAVAAGQGEVERGRHAPGDVRLHLEDVGHVGVERVLPRAHRRHAGRDAHQLGRTRSRRARRRRRTRRAPCR